MNATCQIKDQILEQALPEVVFDGWADLTIYRAIEKAGLEREIYSAVFPDGITDVIAHFSDWADRQMLRRLEETNIEDMRIRDRIRRGVLTRLDVLEPHKEAVQSALKYWSVPYRSPKASKNLWLSADRIWLWAGDTAQDYNKYTKRMLLSGILASTTYTWLQDDSEDYKDTKTHLDKRIENVMSFGKFVSKFKCNKKEQKAG